MTRASNLGESGIPAPVYDDGQVRLYCGDCRDILPLLAPVDVVVTDPPYGDTSLRWDVSVDGWMPELERLTRQLWCFGSLRFFMARRDDFAGWRYGQEIVWEKHNGSGFAADRFKRVHESVTHWYRGAWTEVYKDPPMVGGYKPKGTCISRKADRTPHTGSVGESVYEYTDERIQRSVIRVRSMHGRAIHETEKPTGVLTPLIAYSCPPGGLVLDPFAGSCSTLVAARETGRRAIGIEIDPEKCRRAVAERLEGSLFEGAAA